MKFIDNIKDFFFASYDDSDDDVSEPEEKAVAEVPVQQSEPDEPVATKTSVRENRESREIRERESRNIDSGNGERISRSTNRRNQVVNIQTTAQLQVVLVKPSAFTDAKQIADHLIAKKTVVLNLETASPENKRRIIDFLVGVAYANGGSLKPVANLTYIITPYNVGFIGEDLVGELENNGVFI